MFGTPTFGLQPVSLVAPFPLTGLRRLKFSIGSTDISFTMNNAVSATTMYQPNGAPPMDDEILTVMDVARFLRVPKSTVYKLARVGELPASKIGKHWRFLRHDIHAWMHSRSQQG